MRPKKIEIFRENNAVTIRVEASREARALRGNIVKEDDMTETDLMMSRLGFCHRKQLNI
jgi:hypothetical protein